MHIQNLPPSEAARLIPLLQDLHRLHVAHQPDRHPENPDDLHLTQWLSDWLQQDGITALEAQSPQGALLGYLIYELEQRPALPIRKAEHRLMVHHIAVAQPFRRMGVGTALLTEVKRRAKTHDVDTIATSYAPFNTASQGLFSGMGLEPVTVFAEWRS